MQKMTKKTIAEAAADILKASKANAPAQPQQKLASDPGYDNEQGGPEDLGGDLPDRVASANPDATRPVSKNAPPGATPPIGQESDARTRDLDGNNETESDLQQRGPNKVQYKTSGDGSPASRGQTPDAELSKQRGDSEYVGDGITDLDQVGEEVELFEDEEGNIYAQDENGELVQLTEEDLEQLAADLDAQAAEEEQVVSEEDDTSVVIFDREKIYEQFKAELDKDLGDLLDADTTLTEDFKKKAQAVFEAAVMARVNTMADILEQAFVSTLEESIDEIKAGLTEKVNDYLSYVAEEWMKENEIALEKSLRTELTEDFIAGLRSLFQEHWIEIPEDKVNVIDELTAELDEKEGKLDESIQREVELNKRLKSFQAQEVFTTVCEKLTDVQKDKMKSLSEGLEFTTADEYKEKLELVRDNYFVDKTEKVEKKPEAAGLNEAVEIDDGKKKPAQSSDPWVGAMAGALSRTATK